MVRKPNKEEIEARAYEIYLQRGAEPGRELEDWVTAEQELSGQAASEMGRDAHSTDQPSPFRSARTVAAGGSGRS